MIELFNENELSQDGTVSLQSTSYSEDGSLLAYSFSKLGSDWIKIKIRKVETCEDYPEVLENIKSTTVAWTHDNKGFFYSVSQFGNHV